MSGAGLLAAVALMAACAGTAEVDGAAGSAVAAGDGGGSADVDGAGHPVDGAGGSVVAAGDGDGSGAAWTERGEQWSRAGDAAGSEEVDGTGDAAGAVPRVEVEGSGDRLLTDLWAQVGPEGVLLMWTVDEARAGRITGFACSYRAPSHIRFGVTGVIGCGAGFGSPGARSAVVAELPEYGDYDFEVVANVGDGPAIYWGERALRLRVAVTEDLAGPPGPGLAVSGAGPVVTGCGPGDGPGVSAPQRPWQLSRIVSDTHLTHYPGRGWSAGGDPATPPDWPEPRPLDELLDEAGLDGGAVDRAAAGTSEEQQAAAAALLADERGAAVVALISARTKALLRPGSGSDPELAAESAPSVQNAANSPNGPWTDPGSADGWELRLHSGYPFGADYVYEPAHAVAGWGDPAHAVAWPALYERTDCPPPSQPDAIHDVALALADTAAAGGARLEHSGYGWWAVEPVGAFPERIVATKGGLSFGDPAAAAPEAPAVWRGRATGHLFWDRQRFALAGDVTVTLVRSGDTARLAGRIDGVVVVPLRHDSLEPRPGPPVPWRTLTLDPADPAQLPPPTPADPAAADPAAADPDPAGSDGAWSGAVRVDAAAPGGSPAAMRAADAFAGDWQAAAYGPEAAEIAGRLRLWIPPADGADPSTDWPAQAVLVAGFGASRTS